MPDTDVREPVTVGRVGPVMVVTLDRAHKRNAINAVMTRALDTAFETLESDPELRVGILAGTGPVFCAGSDLLEGPGAATPAGGEYGFVRRVRSKPVLAAVEGPAAGGGFELVLACDLVVATPAAAFSLPEATRGRVPRAGALFRGSERLPRNVAAELMLAGGRLDAERAFALGLVNRLVPPGQALAAALELAFDVCGSAPSSVAAVLRALRSLDQERESSGWDVTSAAVSAVVAAAEHVEGNAAFAERRPPSWVPERPVERGAG